MHHLEAVVAVRVVLLHDDFELGIADAAALTGECLGRDGTQEYDFGGSHHAGKGSAQVVLIEKPVVIRVEGPEHHPYCCRELRKTSLLSHRTRI